MRWSQRRIRVTRNNVIGLPRITRDSPTTTQPTHVRSLPDSASPTPVIARVLPRGLLTCRLRHICVPVTGLLMLRATRTITGYTATVQARLAKVRHTPEFTQTAQRLAKFCIPYRSFLTEYRPSDRIVEAQGVEPCSCLLHKWPSDSRNHYAPKAKKKEASYGRDPPLFLC
jgi:hypothetical protein